LYMMRHKLNKLSDSVPDAPFYQLPTTFVLVQNRLNHLFRLARPLPFPTDSTAPPRRYYSSEQRWLAPVVNRRRKGKIQWSRGHSRRLLASA